MTSTVKPPNQRVPLAVLDQWHSIARGATAEQIAIAFRGRRDVEQRHLLRHNFRVHFSSLADSSSATIRAGVESARIQLPEGLANEVLEWTRSRDGLRTIGALTVAMDVLFRILEDTTDELPSRLTWEQVGPKFIAALRHLCSVKIEEIDRDHEVRPPVQTMMVNVLTRARRFVQVSSIWNVTYREIFAAMIRPAGMFIEMGRQARMGVESPARPERLDTLDVGAAKVETAPSPSPDDQLTRPMSVPALQEDPPTDTGESDWLSHRVGTIPTTPATQGVWGTPVKVPPPSEDD